MSTTAFKTLEGLTDSKCKKGQLSIWPPVPYVPLMDLVTTKEAPESLKIKLPDGTIFNMSISLQGNTEGYLAHVIAVLHLIHQKGLDVQCRKQAKAVDKLARELNSLLKAVPRLLSYPRMTWRLKSWRLSRPNRCSKKPIRLTMRQLQRCTSF